MMPSGADQEMWDQLVGVVGSASWLSQVANNPADEVQGNPERHASLKTELVTLSEASTLPMALKEVLKL